MRARAHLRSYGERAPMTHTPLRIAVDVGPLYGHRTGVGHAVAGIVDALAGRDDVACDPYLVSFRSRPRAGHRRLPVPGIVASHVWSRADRPSADRWLLGADVVHGTNYVAPPTSRPTVVSVYDCWFLEHPERADRVVRRAGRALARSIARGAWVHASSEATASRVRSVLGTDRVVVVPLGPPPAPAPLSSLARPAVAGALRGAPFVVAVGTEEHRKDLPRLVAAFVRAAEELPSAHLVLAGAPGNGTAALDHAISVVPAELAERVHRLGPVDDEVKHWLLRQAAVLAYPSIDEGFGFPILEAQLAGTPVVASSVGSIPEIAGGGAVLVNGPDVDAFAAALTSVVGSGVGRLGLIEAGHRNVARFSWERTADGLVELYARAAGEGAA